MMDWIASQNGLIWTIAGAASVLMFVGTLLAIPPLVARMPADYFVRRKPPPGTWRDRHRVVRWTLVVLKNVVGLTFLILGVSMFVLPGQGILTVLIALMLMDYPKKREFELWIARRKPVRRALNWIRRRAKRPPLLLPPEPIKPARAMAGPHVPAKSPRQN